MFFSAGNAGFTYEAEQGISGLVMDVIEACVSGKDGRVVWGHTQFNPCLIFLSCFIILKNLSF